MYNYSSRDAYDSNAATVLPLLCTQPLCLGALVGMHAMEARCLPLGTFPARCCLPPEKGYTSHHTDGSTLEYKVRTSGEDCVCFI